MAKLAVQLYNKKASFLFMIFLAIESAGLAAGGSAIRIENSEGVLSIIADSRSILEYHYKKDQFKPYVKTLCSPKGTNVLLDSPEDHKHHHGLMFAVNADGVNFWEEIAAAGRQAQKNVSVLKSSSNNNGASAFFESDIDWVNPSDNELVLKEKRSVQIDLTESLEATLLTWRSELKAPEGKSSVKLDGSHYFGLGMRFVRSMDDGGPFFNADGGAGEVFRGDERLVQSKWCAYTAKADGKIVTIAMFDHPRNPRHPALWFTMAKPFAYLSATIGLHEEPFEIYKDKPVCFCYGVAVWDGQVDKDKIEKAYIQWMTLQKPEK